MGSFATLHSTITNNTNMVPPIANMLITMGDAHGKYAPPEDTVSLISGLMNLQHGSQTSGYGYEQEDYAR